MTVDLIEKDGWSGLEAFEARSGRGWLTHRPTFQWLRRLPPDDFRTAPPLWVARKDGRVIGRQAAMPLTLTVDGETVEALWAVDLLVDPEWRLKGVGPLLMETLVEAAPVVLAMGVTEAAHRMYRRAGWLDLGHIPRWVRPLRPARMAEIQVVKRRLGPLATAMDGAVGLVDRMLARRQRRRGYRLERVARFDPDEPEPLVDVSSTYRASSRRDGAFLRWRFDEAPDADRYVRYYLLRDSTRVGYAVLHRVEGPGGPIVEILDCLAGPGHLRPLLRLLMVTEEARESLALHYMALNRPARKSLRLAGFLPRVPHLRFMVHLRDDARHLEPVVGDPDRWLITMADGDIRIDRARL